MRSIWKYQVRTSGQPYEQRLPAGAKLLYLDKQLEFPHIWIEIDDQADEETRVFQVVGTGHRIPEGATYVGTWQTPPFVWHLYELTQKHA